MNEIVLDYHMISRIANPTSDETLKGIDKLYLCRVVVMHQ
jgi:hypothetical protein